MVLEMEREAEEEKLLDEDREEEKLMEAVKL